MNNLTSLLALLVGIITFFVNDSLAVTLFGIYFVLAGLIGLLNGAEADAPYKMTERAKSAAELPAVEPEEDNA